MTYKLIAFDFDGTLADTFPWFLRVMNEIAGEYRFKAIPPDRVDEFRRLDAREIMRRLEAPAWKLPLIARRMRAMARADRGDFRLFPGVEEALRALIESGAQVAVVSSNAEDNVRHVLGEALSSRMRFACGASLFGKARKLARLMRGAGVGAQSALYVGDEIRDGQAARAVGVAFGAVTWGYTEPAALAACAPDMIFAQPRDILQALATGGGNPDRGGAAKPAH